MADESKTEKASRGGGRRRASRGKSPAAASDGGLGAMTAIVFCAWQMPAFAGEWRSLMRQELTMAATRPSSSSGVAQWPGSISRRRVGRRHELAGGYVCGLAQGGVVFAPSALAPNWKRLDRQATSSSCFRSPPSAACSSLCCRRPWSSISPSECWCGIGDFPRPAARQPHHSGGLRHRTDV